jgi:hypothetical protein
VIFAIALYFPAHFLFVFHLQNAQVPFAWSNANAIDIEEEV